MADSVRSSMTIENTDTPTIKVKAASFIAILQEKDEAVAKLGGENDKKEAFAQMQSNAEEFFQNLQLPNISGIWDHKKQALFHEKINQVCSSSRIQIVGAPISITYEEQNQGVLGARFLMRLILSVGRMSIKEIIISEKTSSTPDEEIDVIKFSNSSTSDFKLTYEVGCTLLRLVSYYYCRILIIWHIFVH